MTDSKDGLTGLLARAESRRPWTPDDTKSGARFERVVIEAEPFVLKYQDPRDDWLLRASGDPGRAYVRLWESGLLGRLPPEIDHAVVAADYDGEVGRVLLRDVGSTLLEPDTPFTAMQHRGTWSTWPPCTRPSGAGTTMSASLRWSAAI